MNITVYDYTDQTPESQAALAVALLGAAADLGDDIAALNTPEETPSHE